MDYSAPAGPRGPVGRVVVVESGSRPRVWAHALEVPRSAWPSVGGDARESIPEGSVLAHCGRVPAKPIGESGGSRIAKLGRGAPPIGSRRDRAGEYPERCRWLCRLQNADVVRELPTVPPSCCMTQGVIRYLG